MSTLVITLQTGGERGPKGDPGERGLQGERGGDGRRGPPGSAGERGPMGQGIVIRGYAPSFAELPPTAEIGDGYIVGRDLLIYIGVSAWQNMGEIRGPQGERGVQGNQGEIGPVWINWREAGFVSGSDYAIGDGVLYLDPVTQQRWTLRCAVAHTAGAAPDLANWQRVMVSARGPQGERGAQGERGEVGPRGIGERGPQGERGITGTLGESWRGAWVANANYLGGEIVSTVWQVGAERHYVLLGAVRNHLSTPATEPTQEGYAQEWFLIATVRDGVDGRNGEDGVSTNIITITDEQQFEDYIAGSNEIVMFIDA